MGAWGTGIFQDDTACDVRDTFRELIAEGQSPEAATGQILAEYDTGNDSTVVWIALAATQSKLGRLIPRVRDRALEIIHSDGDLAFWPDPRERNRRRAMLTKLAAQLVGVQPTPKRVRISREHATTWAVGDLIRYRLLSDRSIVLRVLRLWPNNRKETSFDPCCDIADWIGVELPARKVLASLPSRMPVATERYRASAKFILSPSAGRNFPAHRLEVVGRGCAFNEPIGSIRVITWQALDAKLATAFGITG
jgi:hypothetical protein